MPFRLWPKLAVTAATPSFLVPVGLRRSAEARRVRYQLVLFVLCASFVGTSMANHAAKEIVAGAVFAPGGVGLGVLMIYARFRVAPIGFGSFEHHSPAAAPHGLDVLRLGDVRAQMRTASRISAGIYFWALGFSSSFLIVETALDLRDLSTVQGIATRIAFFLVMLLTATCLPAWIRRGSGSSRILVAPVLGRFAAGFGIASWDEQWSETG